MSFIPPPLAQRIDRLSRWAHAFHRFAHHPLCDAYSGELLRVGRRARICRGCTLAVGGAIAGAVAGCSLPVPPLLALVTTLGTGFVVAALSVRAPRSHHRASKLLTRSLPVGLAAALVVFGARTRTAWGGLIMIATASCALVAIARYRRRGPDRSPCHACPERGALETCSGFRPIARREAAFARVAGRLLRAVPASPSPITRAACGRMTEP